VWEISWNEREGTVARSYYCADTAMVRDVFHIALDSIFSEDYKWMQLERQPLLSMMTEDQILMRFLRCGCADHG